MPPPLVLPESVSVNPKIGSIVPLRTKGEFDARVVTQEAHVVALTPRFASDALALIRDNFPCCADFDLTHLRRFVKYAYLPSYVRFYAWWYNGASDPRWDDKPELHNQDRTLLYLLATPTTVSKEDLLDCLVNKSTGELHEEFKIPPLVITTQVPLTPPLSQFQADDMSKRFWPTVYKSSNPFGPHLSIWSRAKAKIQSDAGTFMALAEQVADASFELGIGLRVGAVVVDRRSDSVQVLAAAGDARWMGLLPQKDGDTTTPRNPCCDSGNVMAHAAMRAIDMVARKRARAGKRSRVPTSQPGLSDQTTDSQPTPETNHSPENGHSPAGDDDGNRTPSTASSPPALSLLDPDSPFHPQTEIEQEIFDPINADPDGYLCLNHEIYLTHEPCVMCSMAILHSRFGVCVFGQPMIQTGGLRAGGQIYEGDGDVETVKSGSKRKLDSDDTPACPPSGGDWLSLGGPLPTYKVPYNEHDERDGYLYEVEAEEVAKPSNSRIVTRANDTFRSSCFGLFWRPELNWKFLAWQWIDRNSDMLGSDSEASSSASDSGIDSAKGSDTVACRPRPGRCIDSTALLIDPFDRISL